MKLYVWTDTQVNPESYPRVAYWIVDSFTKEVWGHATTLRNDRYRNGATTNSILGEVLAFEFMLSNDLVKSADEIEFFVDNAVVRDWIRGDKKPKASHHLICEVLDSIARQLVVLKGSYTINLAKSNLADILLRRH